MSSHDGGNAVHYIAVGAFAAVIGYVLGVLAAFYVQTAGDARRLVNDEDERIPDQDYQEEDLVEHEEQLRDEAQHLMNIALEEFGEFTGHLIVRDVEDGLVSIVRDEQRMGPGRRQ